MERREIYRGFEIRWEDPPRTTAGWELNIASEDRALLERMYSFEGEKRGSKVITGANLEGALAEAKAFIDRVAG